MDEYKSVNARIKRTHLGFEDHGILTIWLHLEYDSGGQGFGGYVLDDKPLDEDRGKAGYTRQPSRLAGRSIACILKALEVDTWEQIPGTYVRVRKADYFAPITHVGHILKDRWFSFTEAAEAEKLRDQQITMSVIETVPPTVQVQKVIPQKVRDMLERIALARGHGRRITQDDQATANALLATFPTAAFVKEAA